MDTNLLFSILFAIIIIEFILIHDEGMILFPIGFFMVAVFFNLDTFFGITINSYNGWGRVFQGLYLFIPVFAFGKTLFVVQEKGFDLTFGKFKRVKNG